MISKHVGYVHIKPIDAIRYNLYWNGEQLFYEYKGQHKQIKVPGNYINVIKRGQWLIITLSTKEIKIHNP